jgi:NtrC-family two-component system response regulator AlgB
MRPSVLLVGDVSARLDAFRRSLSDAMVSVATHPDLPRSLRNAADGRVVTTVVVSLASVETDSTDLVHRVRRRWPWVSLLLVDGPSSPDIATAALKAGAQDYLVQNRSSAAEMAEAVTQSLRARSFMGTDASALQYANEAHMVGNSSSMKAVFDRLETASKGTPNVLIRGEPGTGRSLMAHAIHIHSSSKETPLLTLNGRCLSRRRARALFFGERRDGPTDSTATLGTIYRGTVVLDHLNEADRAVQDLLSHALDNGHGFTPDPSRSDRPPIQVIGIISDAPTSPSLRSDLYYRLAELPMALPPLRDRPEDLFPLTRHFLHQHPDGGPPDDRPFTREARTALREYSWPGNVRQLKNVVLRAARRHPSSPIERDDLLLPDPQRVPNPHAASPAQETPSSSPPLVSSSLSKTSSNNTRRPASSTATKDDIVPLQEVKKQAVQQAYEAFDGDVDQAAVALDIGRSTMYRMLKRHDLWDDDK